MAEKNPNTPDDKKTVPAGKEENNKAIPGNEPKTADGKIPAPNNVIPLVKENDNKTAAKEAGQSAQDKKAEVPPTDKKTEDKGDTAKADKKATPAKEDKQPEPGLSPEDEKLKQEQEAALKELDEKAALYEKNNPAPKKTRTARPPTGVKKGEATPPEPEKAPEPVDAPRHGEKEEIVHIKLNELFPFKDHPFQVKDDAEMRAMVESVKDKGVTQPAIVRPREDGGYELVSGHRRQKASELAGYSDMPCIVRNLTDEQAITQMVEDNTNQRETLLPSERAKAYKMQLDAIKRQGVRDGNGGNGQRSNEIVAERNNMNAKQVQRYIKLNDLVPELLKMADEGVLKFTPAVELAFVSKKNQQYIAMTIESQQSSPNLSQAQRMRELDNKKTLNPDVIDGIMLEEKKEADKVILSTAELSQYFGKDKTPREMKDTIMTLLDDYKAKQAEISPPDKTKKQPEKE